MGRLQIGWPDLSHFWNTSDTRTTLDNTTSNDYLAGRLCNFGFSCDGSQPPRFSFSSVDTGTDRGSIQIAFSDVLVVEESNIARQH